MCCEQPIVTDTSDFQTLIQGGYVYVDKTAYLHRMISGMDGRFFFMSRPRRFGKSLMISTLEQIFKANRDLFKGLAIDSTDYEWKPYPVIHLDLSLIKTDTAEGYRHLLCDRVRSAAQSLGVDLPDDREPGLLLCHLLTAIAERNEQAVVLVDEYDAPISGLIGKPELLEAVQALLHDFYAAFKAMSGSIRFMMMTGVSKFAKLSIFSGLNNLTDLTMRGEYAGLLGYTPQELKAYFKPHINAFARHLKTSATRVTDELLAWYDSYRFSPSSEVKVCNPVSVGRALSERRFYGFWNATGNASLIIERLRAADKTPLDLDTILVRPERLDVCDIASLPLAALLYQGGYLTIKDETPEGLLVLGVPNKEVRQALDDGYVAEALQSHADEFTSLATRLSGELASTDNPGAVLDRVLKSIFAMVPHEWKIKSEAEAKRYFLLFMKMAGATINAEVESANGRADAILETPRSVYIVEFKYGHTAAEALQQCYDRNYVAPYASDSRRIVLVGVNIPAASTLPDSVAVDVLGTKDHTGGDKEKRVGAKEDRLGAKDGLSFLRVLANGELSAKAISEKLSVKPTTRSFRKQLNRLLDNGLLVMSNPESPHSRLQKYRLTEKARALLNPHTPTDPKIQLLLV